MKYVDDTDTGTDILSELNALSEQMIETDTSANLTPTLADVEPTNRLSTSATLTNQQQAAKQSMIGESASIKDRTIKGVDNRLSGLVDDLQATLQTPLSSNSLSRPTSALSVQSGQSATSSISATLAHHQLRPSCSNDLRHYQVGFASTITQVPWNNFKTTVQSTAISTQSTYSDNQFFSRPSSKLDRQLTARQSFDLNEGDVKLGEIKDLRCADQTRCLLTLRRKAELRKRKAFIDSRGLLDLSYAGLTLDRFLLNSHNWNFNSFTLDLLSGGHSLSQLLVYFFCKYNFIQIYHLDMTAVWKCFRKYSCFFKLKITNFNYRFVC